jgi:hypothetical protein
MGKQQGDIWKQTHEKLKEWVGLINEPKCRFVSVHMHVFKGPTCLPLLLYFNLPYLLCLAPTQFCFALSCMLCLSCLWPCLSCHWPCLFCLKVLHKLYISNWTPKTYINLANCISKILANFYQHTQVWNLCCNSIVFLSPPIAYCSSCCYVYY